MHLNIIFGTINSPSVVSSETNQHNTSLADFAFGLELHLSGLRLHGIALNDGGIVAV